MSPRHCAASFALVLAAGACGSPGGAPSGAGLSGPSASPAPPVQAPRRPVTRTYFGVPVTEDYAWLEDGDAPEVRAFTEAQGAFARQTLDALPGRAAVRARVAELLEADAPDWLSIERAGDRLFALKRTPPRQQPVLVDLGVAPGGAVDPAAERVVLDPGEIDPSGKTSIDFFVPSPDGKLVAVSLSKDGTESGDVHVVDVATGRATGDVVTRVHGGTAGGSLAWNAAGTGFFYTRYPRPGERPEADLDFYQQVWTHELGAPAAHDRYALGEGFPRIAETSLVRSDDGQSVLALVSNGDGGEVEHHVLHAGAWRRLSRFEDALGAAAFGPDGRLYAVSRAGAPRGKVVAFAPPFDRPPALILPEGALVIDDLRVTSDALYVLEVDDGPSRVRRLPLDPAAEPLAREAPKPPAKRPRKNASKKPVKKASKRPAAPAPPPEVIIAPGARGRAGAVLPLPPVSSVTGAVRVGDDLLFRVESYVAPPRWLLYRAGEHRVAATPLAKRAAYGMADVEVSRETCLSKDGTRVPMTVLARRGARRDGAAPGYLTGYGGFGVTLAPRMRVSHRVWLDAGGVVAEANLRGGGERGEDWHRAGMLTNKQNVFDDFAACARALFDLGYTSPERLAISGRSNGGLLVSATLVQHPGMFRAALAAVGLHDMLRSELTANGAFNVTEYGSVLDEAQFRALRAYSPYHNVTDGAGYPAVLLTTGVNDPRVDPMHARKMAARLQAASASGRPVLLRVSDDTGHGMGTPLAAEIEETTDALAFLLHEVGARPRRAP